MNRHRIRNRRRGGALLALALLALLAPGLAAQGVFPSTHIADFRIAASGSDTSTGTGVGLFRADRQGGALHYRITFANCNDSLTTASLYSRSGNGARRVLATIPVPAGTGTMEGMLPVDAADLAAAIDSSLLVLDIASTHYPNGFLSAGLNEVPTAGTLEFSPDMELHKVDSSDGRGMARIILDRAARTARYAISWDNLTGPPTNIAFYRGERNETGPLAYTLNIAGSEGGLLGQWTDMSDEDINALLESRIYVNVLTEKYPAGEIRASFIPLHVMTTAITPDQVVPSGTGGTATGTGYLAMLIDEDQILVNSVAVMAGSADSIGMVQLHLGAPGENGIAVFPHKQRNAGFWQMELEGEDISAVPQDVRSAILRGMVYIQASTESRPNGETRGSFTRTAGSYTASAPSNSPDAATGATLSASASSDAVTFRIGGARPGIRRSIVLYSAIGDPVAETTAHENHATIATGSLASGMYLARLVVDGAVAATTRVMIVR